MEEREIVTLEASDGVRGRGPDKVSHCSGQLWRSLDALPLVNALAHPGVSTDTWAALMVAGAQLSVGFPRTALREPTLRPVGT